MPRRDLPGLAALLGACITSGCGGDGDCDAVQGWTADDRRVAVPTGSIRNEAGHSSRCRRSCQTAMGPRCRSTGAKVFRRSRTPRPGTTSQLAAHVEATLTGDGCDERLPFVELRLAGWEEPPPFALGP
jgi:hypothetical protein